MDTKPSPEHVRIDSINISIGGQSIVLTPEQARKLLSDLNDLIGKATAAPVYAPVPYVPVPWHIPVYTPIWINPNVEPWPNHWQVTCGATGNSYTSLNINS